MIQILLNGYDISSAVVFPSLRVDQNLTNEVDAATFDLRSYSPDRMLKEDGGVLLLESGDALLLNSVPTFNDDVRIIDGGTIIFAGKVAQTRDAAEHPVGSYLQVFCVDHTFEMDRLLAQVAYTDMSVHDILADLVTRYAPGFTYNNVSSTFVIPRIVFNQVPLSQCIRKLADIVRCDWYVDENKDLHFFEKSANLAPFDLTDTAGNYVYGSLERTADGSQVVNRVKVRGGEYDGASFTDTITVLGTDTKSFNLPYKMANLTIQVDAGSGFVSKIVGLEYVDDFPAVDVLYNFQSQSFRFQNTLANGTKVKFSGNPKTPVLAVAEDTDSVERYGPIEKLIRDTSIASNDTARKRALAELLAFSDVAIDARFHTYTAGLRAGMILNIQSDLREIDDSLIIKHMTFTARTPFVFEYDVRCISTQRYTLMDVLRKLLTPDPRPDDEKEVSEQLYPTSETVVATDEAFMNAVAPSAVRWVYGFYAPTSLSDPKRMARYGTGAKWASYQILKEDGGVLLHENGSKLMLEY